MVGTIILIDGVRFRVIGQQGGVCSLIEMDTSKIALKFIPENVIRQNLRNGMWSSQQESPLVVDFQRLSEKEREKIKLRQELMKAVVSTYGPMFDSLLGKGSKPIIKEASLKYEMSQPTVWRLIRIYLQSGLNDAVLANKNAVPASGRRTPYNYKKRPGRKNQTGIQSLIVRDAVLVKRFDEAIDEFLRGREQTLADAYSWLIDNYYSVTLPTGETQKLPFSECPTKKQFYDYARHKIDKEEKDRIKTSFADQRNNNRLLFSSSRIDAVGPGRIMEVDAWEAKVKIISEVDGSLIGKPIVYCGIDVYSSAIGALAVSLENNSLVGLTNLLLNLSDDKHKFAEVNDYSFDDGLWPSNYLPQEFRCDRGSDFKSNEFGEICQRLGVTRTLVSGGTGSYKGIVEQSFNQFLKSIRASIESKGLITYRHDDDSDRTACMYLRDFVRMAITFVVTHNSKPIPNYPMDAKMIREGLITSPCEIWKYGIREHGAPTPITAATMDHFLFNIMPEYSAVISRRGVSKDDLWYRNNDPELLAQMYALGSKHGRLSIHYDPRDTRMLYYLKNGHVETLTLNEEIPGQEDFLGMTWQEYDKYRKAKNELIKRGEEVALNIRSFRRQTYNQIVSACASNMHQVSTKMEIRENRAIEKQRTNYENRIAPRMVQDQLPAQHSNSIETKEANITRQHMVYETLNAEVAGRMMMELE